jgi:hypothetical protein
MENSGSSDRKKFKKSPIAIALLGGNVVPSIDSQDIIVSPLSRNERGVNGSRYCDVYALLLYM